MLAPPEGAYHITINGSSPSSGDLGSTRPTTFRPRTRPAAGAYRLWDPQRDFLYNLQEIARACLQGFFAAWLTLWLTTYTVPILVQVLACLVVMVVLGWSSRMHKYQQRELRLRQRQTQKKTSLEDPWHPAPPSRDH